MTCYTFFRLPQDVYQTAKVSKLLLAINKGKAAKYKGKSLEDIEFSDNVDSDTDIEESFSRREEKIVEDDIGTCSERNEKVELQVGQKTRGINSETRNQLDSSKTKSDNLNLTFNLDSDKNTGIQRLLMFLFRALISIYKYS